MTWRYLKWRTDKIYRRLIRAVCSEFYHDIYPDFSRNIFVAGAGRSGTTWIADLIASQIRGRMMFEPFYSELVSAFSRFQYFQYMRPDEENAELLVYCRRIFSGDIRHAWIDRHVEYLRPRCRIIKDIRANLFLRWIHMKFPQIPLLFIIRHPCAVVLSRMQLDWATDTDIDPFLAQQKLIDDFLHDKMDVILRARTPEEKHAIVWCVSNLIPLRQFQGQGIHLLHYEHICLHPQIAIPRIFNTIKMDFDRSLLRRADKPSSTAIKNSAIMTGKDRINSWKNVLTKAQIDRILRIVQAFELDYLYQDAAVSCELEARPR